MKIEMKCEGISTDTYKYPSGEVLFKYIFSHKKNPYPRFRLEVVYKNEEEARDAEQLRYGHLYQFSLEEVNGKDMKAV